MIWKKFKAVFILLHSEYRSRHIITAARVTDEIMNQSRTPSIRGLHPTFFMAASDSPLPIRNNVMLNSLWEIVTTDLHNVSDSPR